MKKVAVIGAGVSGLVCAQKLAEQDLKVVVFEKENYLGGLASWYNVDGLNIPRTYHHVLKSDRILLRTIRELGVQTTWRRVKIGLFSGGKTYPMNRPWDLLRLEPLSFTDRIKFGLLVLSAKRAKNLEGVDLKNWVERNASRSVFEKLIAPLISAYFGSAEGISAAYLANRWKTESTSVTGLLGYVDISQIILGLKEKILAQNSEIITDTEVTRIREVGGSFVVEAKDKSFEADYVISTVPAPITAKICEGLPKDLAKELEKIRYKCCICVTYWLKERASDYYWVISLDEKIPFVACFEHANLNPNVGGGVVYVVAYCDLDDKIWQTKDEEIAKYYAEYVPFILKNFKDIKKYRVYRSEWATPVFRTGFKNPPLKTPIKNLYLAGISRIFPDIRSMGPAIKTGLEAGGELLSDMRGR
ncbi:MAG: FAD-dependent oxidoreductase [Methanocellales archaeon]|nr:FAD-dependent oxidoreductase [Methanocellales archaeon]